MGKRWLFVLLICCTFFAASTSQVKKYPNNFVPPMDIPLYLSANFGELRSGHFHTGIDIKTQGKTGPVVRSIDEGYVSRINISPVGYGLAVYITHPNGYTSVYGHLERFSTSIQTFARKVQYNTESYAIDTMLAPGLISISKGTVIGYSGNSGSSGGPHLHFEIRRTVTEHPLNPLHFGFNIKDDVRPQLLSVTLFPLDGKGLVNGGRQPISYPVVFYNNRYHLKGAPRITVSGKVGIGIETLDYLTGDWSKCGTYAAKLSVDNSPAFAWTMDSLSFDKGRYINTFVHYPTRVTTNRWVIKLFRDEPNNKLTIYTHPGNGILQETSLAKHAIDIEVADVYGNKGFLTFTLNRDGKKVEPHTEKGVAQFGYNKDNVFERENFFIQVPSGALYNSIEFKFNSEKSPQFYSQIFSVHTTETALHKPVNMGIKPTVKCNTGKLYVAELSKQNKPIATIGSRYRDGWVVASTRNFGRFALMYDTVPPTIRSYDVYNGAVITGKKQLQFKITDAGSGIAHYRGEIEGMWILLEYDAKSNMLTYYFDESRVKKGTKHLLTLEVSDQVKNVQRLQYTFTW